MILTIDNHEVEARDGETILEVALRHGIDIPHLCTHPDLPPFGACRLCLVEVEGMRGFPASCSTPAAEGMVVRTATEPLAELRRGILELILLEHPSACMVCDERDLCEEFRPRADKAGRTTGCHTCNNKEACEVKTLAGLLGVEELPIAPTYRDLPIERGEPFIDRDLNLCILCGRCVRICKAHQGASVIDFVGRGSATRIGEAFGRTLAEAGCTFCGSCVDVCPTGALADRYAKWHGRPEESVESTCLLCDEGCALRLNARGGKLVSASAARGGQPVCVLGRFAIPEFMNGGDRLRAPEVRVGEVLRPVGWDDALARSAELLAPHRGEAFALICDTSSTLEDRVVWARFTHEVMRSPHYIEVPRDAAGRAPLELPPGVRAALLTGPFLPALQVDELPVVIVADLYHSAASRLAHVVLPAAAFTEVNGTFIDGEGRARPLTQAARAPGQARPDWQIAVELARALGAGHLDFDAAWQIANSLHLIGDGLKLDPPRPPAAARDPRRRATHYRGHALVERVHALRVLSLESPAAPSTTSRRPAEARQTAGG